MIEVLIPGLPIQKQFKVSGEYAYLDVSNPAIINTVGVFLTGPLVSNDEGGMLLTQLEYTIQRPLLKDCCS